MRDIAATTRATIPANVLFPFYYAYAARRINILLRNIKDPQRLEHYGRQVYSQNEEDGIIEEIFHRIGTTNKRFVEFGCGDGTENNTRLLLEQGWSGLWIDGSKSNVERAEGLLSEPVSVSSLKILYDFITRENINRLISAGGFNGSEIDLLVIDIDGNDAHVWQAINTISPRVVCIEYNASWGHKKVTTIDYDPKFHYTRDGRNIFGASIKLLEGIGQKKGYTLVGCNITGANAFFVRDDVVKDRFVRGSAEKFFHPARYRLHYGFRRHLGTS